MIGPLFSLICLLSYSDTERASLDSRRQFGVNVSVWIWVLTTNVEL